MTAPLILVVEDERIVAEDIRNTLLNRGYRVLSVASSGEQALEQAEEGNPDLVLMDMRIQGDMDGTETARRIRDRFGTPVVYLTAYADEATLDKAKLAEPYGYIIKPFEERELYSVIEIALYKHEVDRKLRESERRFRKMITDAADAIVIVDGPGEVCYVNPAGEALFGRPSEQLLGKAWRYPLTTGETTELEIARARGGTLVGEMRVVQIEWEGKAAYLATIRDVTERVRMQAELERARQEQLEMKDRFLSHVSHELRSPLAVIHQFVTILTDGLAGGLNPEQREYLEITLRNTNQLRSMIADLLEVTRAQTGKLSIEPQSTSMSELISQTIDAFRMAAAAKGVALSADLPSHLPPVYADPGRVRQILVNLIDNAIKFTPSGGSITVRANACDDDVDFLHVSVADTGRGISPESKKRVFDHLYQTEQAVESGQHGLGLGLYICKEWVSRHGGKIWVESQLGKGSIFTFTLPVLSVTGRFASLVAT